MEFKDLVEEGQEYEFYGCIGNYFKLGNVVFEAIEDEDDGYRSYLESVPIVDNPDIFRQFVKRPFANVEVQFTSPDEPGAFILWDKSRAHVWLTVETDYSDTYYPCFVFRYTLPYETYEEFHSKGLCPAELHIEKLI